MAQGPQQPPPPAVQPPYTEDRRKHLDFISATIIRMAACSFQLKGWSVTIVSAILAIIASADTVNPILSGLGLLPAVIFCLLDSAYLMMERQYVRMYEDAVSTTPTIHVYDMRPNVAHKKKAGGIFKALFSWSVLSIHLPLILVLTIVTAVAVQWPDLINRAKQAIHQQQKQQQPQPQPKGGRLPPVGAQGQGTAPKGP